MKKRDLLIIAIVLVAAAAVYAFMRLSGGGGDAPLGAREIIVYLDDKEYARGRIGEEKIIRIEQADGKVNEIIIDAQGVYMNYSTCQNQNCVHQGKLTPQSVEGLALKNWIICLPNRVSVELRVD